jgi:PhnB protein
MKCHPHLVFKGQCEEAFRFYERCFAGKIATMFSYGNSPMAEQVPPEQREKILHATLAVGDSVLMGADVSPEQYEPPKGFYITLQLDDPAEAERIYRMLVEKGTVQMPIQQTFWAARFAVLVDQFGVPWEINSAFPEPKKPN